MRNKKILNYKSPIIRGYMILLIILIMVMPSCKKYLDAKPDKSLVTPSTIRDLQGILDYYRYMNILSSEASEIASDNYYLTDNSFSSLPIETSRNAYLWKDNIFTGFSPDDWQNEYTVVFNANIVLENLKNVTRDLTNANDWDNCMGSALFFRAKAFYEIAQIWTKNYDIGTATQDFGIPLRLNSDFNELSKRSTLSETYKQIITDLKNAIALLPNTPVFPYRPSKPAAYGLLGRTYLTIQDYSNAKLYADSCLKINNKLLDFNTRSSSPTFPFSSIKFTNPEDIMHSVCRATNSNLRSSYARIDSNLYNSYNANDLRKTIYFKKNADGSVFFRGSYDGTANNYNGLATDEMYLIRAECLARAGNAAEAMNDLNNLLEKRWKTGTFTPLNATNSIDALNQILLERRKELIFRLLRLTDIKRLNKEGASISIMRIIQGQSYVLSPNDSKYALPIPENVIRITGIEQN